MPRLREILDSIVRLRGDIIQNKNSHTAKGSVRYTEAEYLFNKQLQKLSDKLMSNVSDDQFLTSIRRIIPRNKFNLDMVMDINHLTKLNLQVLKADPKVIKQFDNDCKKAMDIYDKSEKTEEDLKLLYIGGFMNFYEKEEEAIVNKAVKGVFSRFLMTVFEESDLDTIADELEENINDVMDEPEFSDDDIAKLPTDIGDLDFHPLEDDIEELKKSDDFKDDIEGQEILDEVNKIIVETDLDQKDFQSHIAENAGIGNQFEKLERLKSMMPADELDLYEENAINSYTARLKKDTVETKLKALKTFKLEFPETSKETQDKLIELGDYMDEKGITSGLSFLSETGQKEYSFMNMLKVGDEVIKAVKSKNKDKILETSKKMIELEKAHDEISHELNLINNTSDITSNISSSRNEQVPYKYRNDYRGVSRMNGLFLAKTFANGYNLNFNDLIKNPLKTFVEGAENVKRNGKASQYFKERSGDMNRLLKTLFKPSKNFTKIVGEDNEYFRGSFRIFESISSLEKNKDVRDKLEYASNGVFMYWATLQNDALDHAKTGYVKDPVNMVANFVCAKGDDFTPYIFSPSFNNTTDLESKKLAKPFNRVASIKKSNSKEVIDGMIQIKDFDKKYLDNETVIEGLMVAATDVEKSKIPMTKNDAHIVKYFRRGRQIPELFIDNFNNEKLLSSIKENGVANKEELTNAIKNIAEGQKNYDNTPFWKTIFHREYRDQKNIANNMMNELIAKSQDKDAITEAINLAKEGRTEEARFNELMGIINHELNPEIRQNEMQQGLNQVFDNNAPLLNNSDIKNENEKVIDNDFEIDEVIDEQVI